MTNRERYRRTFEALHVSDERLREVYFMEKSRKRIHVGRFLLVAACIAALLTVSAFAANEVTDGAVFQTIYTIFVNDGNADITQNDDGSLTVITEDGDIVVVSSADTGGGVTAVTDDGTTFKITGSTDECEEGTMGECVISEESPAADAR